MSNEVRNGLQINPLTLWVAGGLGGALWAVLLIVMLRVLDKQDATQNIVTALATSQQYDRKEIDAVRGDVKSVQADVRGLADRVGRVEARR